MWNKDTIPGNWAKGLSVKLPNKGNLQDCEICGGITLQSTPVLIGATDAAIDTRPDGVSQMDQDCIPKVALRWTVIAKLKQMGLTWGEAQHED